MTFYKNIKALKIKNFRVFKEEFQPEFRLLTIFTGQNNSGKSALQKLLFLFRNTYNYDKKNSSLENLTFSSNVIEQIDFFENNLNYELKNENLKLSFIMDYEGWGEITVDLFYVKSIENQDAVLKEIIISHNQKKLLKFLSPITDTDDFKWTCDIPETGLDLIYELLLKEKITILCDDQIPVYEKKQYWDNKSNILLPSLLSETVLSDANFFNSTIENRTNGIIRGLLIKNEIYSIDKFLEQYLLLEKSLLYFYIIQESMTGGESEINIDFSIRHWSFVDFFSKAESNDNPGLEQVLYQLQSDILLAKIFISDEYKSCFPRINGSEDAKKNKRIASILKNSPPIDFLEDFSKMTALLVSFHDNTRMVVSQLNSVLRTMSDNYITVSTKNVIKNYYFFNNSNAEDQFFIDFGKKIQNNTESFKSEWEFCNKWLKEFGIAKKIEVLPIVLDNKNIGLSYFLKDGEEKHLVGDSGMGIKMILSIIVAFSAKPTFSFEPKLIHLEEPEVHLHPSFQSKLALLFIDAHHTFKHRFIIETHSEYLIRKLQYLVACNNISSEDVIIHYFNDPRSEFNEEQTYAINIKSNGVLDRKLGSGFVDEADNLVLDLLKIGKHQNN
jgi:predicted ATPase